MKLRVLPLLLALLMILSACGKKEAAVPSESPSAAPSASAKPSDTPAPTPAPTPEATEEPAPVPVPETGLTNPLTGLPMEREEQVRARPVAIMLNNIRKALPMQGNSQADIIYEVLAEGGITRMLGVFQSMEGVGEVGSIRSSRPYYLELALGLDAVYLHAGGSEDAYANIKKWNVTALDCVRTTAYSGIFWRDQGRVKKNGLEHSVLTSGDAIIKNFPNYSFRKEHEAGYALGYTFAEDGTPSGDPAKVIKVPFSGSKTGVFTYDEKAKKYLVEEYGKPFVDGNNGEQVAVTNVVVIRTNCRTYDDYGRLQVDLSGYKGEGWFACGGKIIPITWAKKDLNSPITYSKEDGSPVVFGQGNSYVNIIPTKNTITVE